MTNYYYILFIIFTIVAAMMIIDQNVAIYITLIYKFLKVNVQKFFWIIRFHPIWIDNPIGKWWMMRKYERTIRELAQEISKKQENAVE